MSGADERLVTTLWRLAWRGESVACCVYRNDAGLQLRLESASATILSEPFEMQPRMLARTQALRDSLKRRGWQDS
ncbi:MAG: hypothetical protein AB7P99_00290 [Vicinamibacterales bacterium]